MKKIIISPYDEQYEEDIVQRVCQAIEKNEKYILFLPTRELLNDYRLKILEKKEVVFDLNVKTFDDFLLERTREPIKEELLQNLFIRLAIERAFQEGKLDRNSYYFSEGFVALCRQFIMDLKSSLKVKKLEDLKKNPSLNDFVIIFEYYEKILKENNYKDTYDHYLDFDLEDSWDLIIVNGFYEFRPIEEEMIKKLTERTGEFYFYFQMPEDPTFKKYTKLLKDLSALNFKKKLVKKEELSPFEKLSNSFLNNEKTDTKVQFVEAMDLYGEIYYTGLKILENGEEKLSKTAVIVEDAKILLVIEKIFSELKIPSNIYYTENLLEYVKLREFKSLLEVDREIDFILTYLKSSFLSIEKEKKEGLLVFIEYLKSISSYSLDELKELEDFKELLLNYELHDILERSEKEYLNYRKKEFLFTNFSKILEETNSELGETSLEYLEEFKEFLKDLSLESFKNFLLTLMNQLKKTISLEGVFVGNMLQVRNQKFDTIYFLQMNGETYPNLPKMTAYYNDYNLKTLRSANLDLLSQEDYYDINKMRFLETLSSAEKEIIFLYSNNEEESPSIYLEELFKLAEVQKKEYSLKDYLDPEVIISEDSLRRKNLLLGKEKLPEKVNSFLTKTEEKPLREDYLADFLSGKDSFSSTELETYYQCSKKYFYQFVLKLDLDKKTDHLHLGIAIHQIFEDFHKIYQEEVRSFLKEKESSFENLDDFIESQLRYHLMGNILETTVNHYVDLYKKLVKESILLDLEDLKSHKKVFFPVAFEEEIKYSIGDYKIHGRVDRVETTLDGDLAITDFKLSKSKTAFGDLKNKKSLQLAIYFYFNPEKTKYLRHLLIRGKDINTYYISNDITNIGTKVDIEEERQIIKDLLISIIENIRSGEFSGGSEESWICNYCPYLDFCDKRCI